jgi:energy-coupling factor transport system ATP-binding protein
MSIEIRKLNHIYGKGTPFESHALKDVSLQIENGEFIGLIGHTGSGKSTLIQHINRLMKPTSGEILIEGVNINDPKINIKDIRGKVGLVFQYPEHQLFEMTVYKDVAFGPSNLKLSSEEIDKRVKDALEIVGLNKEVYEHSPFELSGGQKRRVSIAGVLAMKPKILILDEPTAGLDPRGRDSILNEIDKLHKELGITVILVSHSMEDIAKYVDRIIVMDKGCVKLDGATKEVFKQVAELEKIGLAAPKVMYLIKALQNKGFNILDEVTTVQEAHDAILKLIKD